MIALLFLLIALFGSSLGSSTGGSGVKEVPATQVPAVTGIASPYAERRVRAAGLVPVRRRCGPGAIPGDHAVRRQQPAAGTVVPRGARVQLLLAPARGLGVRQASCNAISGVLP